MLARGFLGSEKYSVYNEEIELDTKRTDISDNRQEYCNKKQPWAYLKIAKQ